MCVGVYPLPYRLPLPVLRRSYAHTAVGTDPGGSPVAPRGLCAERQRESAGSWHAPSAFFRHKDKQTNNAAKERGGSGFSRPVTSEAMRAARAKRTDTRLSSPSVSACDTYSYTSRIYHLRGVQKIRTSRVDMHPSPVHVSRKVSNLLELSGKLIVLF